MVDGGSPNFARSRSLGRTPDCSDEASLGAFDEKLRSDLETEPRDLERGTLGTASLFPAWIDALNDEFDGFDLRLRLLRKLFVVLIDIGRECCRPPASIG